MSFAASDYQLASLPPRHFWRRLAAYAIDIILFQIVFTLLFLALSTVTPWDLTLPFLQKQQCNETTTGPLVPKIEAEWPLQKGEVRSNQLCRISWLGSKGYVVFVSKVVSEQGATTSIRAFSTPVDNNGNPVDPNVTARPTSSVVLLILPLAFAYCSARAKRTPGKRLLSLRVTTIEDGPMTLGLAAKREIFKFLPFVLVAVFNLVSLFILRPFQPPIDQLIQQARDASILTADGFLALTGALAPMLLVFALIWWLFPLVIWRGQTFYDRFCDTKVVKD
ncbi:RDD family protein [Rhizobium rhizogenes]|uniref:RDD family protein n=1 Tax=Rhizobium rhizogenes TaxID=359 RepID=UPI00157343CF|nr:RDD family protein [Rhizobium rhizogenes]NTF42276.1 RDD family protein [Rhizobium rhizogenes]